MCLTFDFPEFMGLEITKISERRARSNGICMSNVKMDLESNVLYLNKIDLTTIEIHTEINHVLREGTIGYSTVMRYLRKLGFADSSTLHPEDREIQGPDAIDGAILLAFHKQPFASLL
jgi:hypothetical protein